MDVAQVVSRDFVLLRSDWTADRAVRALRGRTASHVVIHRQDDPRHEYWYLSALKEALEKLAAAPAKTTVFAVFGLREDLAVPSVDARTPADVAPQKAIVTADGTLAGFVDRSAAPATRGPSPRVMRGGSRVPTAGPLSAGDTPQRSLEAEFPDRVATGSVEWLLVHIAAAGATARGLGIALPAGEKLDVVVQARKGFAIEGTDHGTITVPADGDSLPLQFKLKAVDAGQGLIRVLAFHQGEPLGMIEIAPAVDASAAPVARGAVATKTHESKPLASASPQLADLTVFIAQSEAGGKVEYSILLSATDPALELNLSKFGPFELKLDPGKFFSDFFKEIEDLPLDTPAQQELAERRLAAKGSYLAEALLPPALREKLWAVRDQIKSIIVQSEEPWIPWELCKLSGKDGGRIVEGPFLSEAYAITRWVPGIGFRRPIKLQNIALVVPEDSGLPLAKEESDYMLSLRGPNRKVTAITPTFADVQDAFIEGKYDGWHFSGHGVATDANPDRSSIVLTAEERFTPEDLSGQAMNIGIPRPLVFINACQVGRSGMALTGIGGWARRFLGAGAAAFVGAYWSVYDEPAYGFAKELYKQLLGGKPMGEAVRAARVSIRAKGDPTWLAYTVFADPFATVA
jgi:hypothetical protein